MDLTHWVLVGILLLSVLIAVGGFVWMSRILGKDALVARMDKLREKIGPIGVRVAGLVREGRRR